MDVIASPCNKVCTLDADDRFCLGCLRSVAEIAAWASASTEERQAILAAVSQRRGARGA